MRGWMLSASMHCSRSPIMSGLWRFAWSWGTRTACISCFSKRKLLMSSVASRSTADRQGMSTCAWPSWRSSVSIAVRHSPAPPRVRTSSGSRMSCTAALQPASCTSVTPQRSSSAVVTPWGISEALRARRMSRERDAIMATSSSTATLMSGRNCVVRRSAMPMMAKLPCRSASATCALISGSSPAASSWSVDRASRMASSSSRYSFCTCC
mmetsp:Transcript_15473/g.52481  ORF Transcript_15473/g.52481 Transcript_15473/m.52481 type:complete len:210 (+) Transcript_15473:966-1595(+)